MSAAIEVLENTLDALHDLACWLSNPRLVTTHPPLTICTAIALLTLPLASAAHAVEITDQTPARAITILKDESADRRVLFSPQIVTMAECQDGIAEDADDLKDDVSIAICVPADMTEKGAIEGTAPFFDLTQRAPAHR